MKKIYLLIVFTLAITSIRAQNKTNSVIANTSDKSDKSKKLKEPLSQGTLSKKNILDEKKKKIPKPATKDLSGEKTCWVYRPTDNLATVIGYSLVLLASILTFYQWRKDQRWKRKEALMSSITSFNGTPGAWNARQMLIYSDRDIPLWDKEKPE